MDKLLSKIEKYEAEVVVVGMGYVGLPLAMEFARAGFHVTGFDRDHEKVKRLAQGISHVEDVPSEIVQAQNRAGRFSVSSEENVLALADCIVLCVPTPLKKNQDPDMSCIDEGIAAVMRHRHSDLLVVLESTTYPGTTRELIASALAAQGYQVGTDMFVAFSPERVDPGNARFQTRNTPKVIGGITSNCTHLTRALYERVVDRVIAVSSTEAAEMVKLLENTFRAVNIGFINEFALICERLGLNVWEIIAAASTKPFGFMPFSPGPGLGGHCIPIDPLYLNWKMRSLKMPARFIELADSVNSSMPVHVVEKVNDLLNTMKKPMNGSKILIVGVAYKKNIGDVRESPAFEIILGLQRRGAEVAYVDPWVSSFCEHGLAMHGVDPEAPWSVYDALVIVTDHERFDYGRMAREAKGIVDTRNAMAPYRDQGGAIIVTL